MIGFGSSSTLGIGLVIQLRDQFSTQAATISASMKNLGVNANRAMMASSGMMVGMGYGIARVGKAITSGLSSATDSAMEFQRVMITLKALGQMSQSEADGLGNLAKTMGPQFGIGPIEAAKGMEELVKAGMNAKQIPKVLESIMLTAVGSGETLHEVSNSMTDLLMGWGMSVNQAGMVGDILAQGALKSTVKVHDLFESMIYSQNTLKALGVNFNEAVAMMAIVGNTGIKGSKAGIALQNMFQQLTIGIGGGSKKKNAVLEAMGIDPKSLMDAYGNLKKPMDLLKILKKGALGMGNIQRNNALYDLFGVRGGRGESPLVDFLARDGKDFLGSSLEEMMDALNWVKTNKNGSSGSMGANQRIFNEKNTAADQQLKVATANWEAFKVAVGNALLPFMQVALPILTKIIHVLTRIANSGIGKFLIGILSVVGALLIPLGTIIALIGSINLAVFFMTGSFGKFGATTSLAFMNMIKQGLTYIGVLKGINAQQGLNNVGSSYNRTNGQIFQTAATRNAAGMNSIIGNRWKLGLGGVGLGIATNAFTEAGSGANILGNAASGALAGASIGGPWGAVIGGILGGAISMFSGSSNDSDQTDPNQSTSPDRYDRQNPYKQYNLSNSIKVNVIIDGADIPSRSEMHAEDHLYNRYGIPYSR